VSPGSHPPSSLHACTIFFFFGNFISDILESSQWRGSTNETLPAGSTRAQVLIGGYRIPFYDTPDAVSHIYAHMIGVDNCHAI
jgi:hypothetical protein